jgi:hypothetical protein
MSEDPEDLDGGLAFHAVEEVPNPVNEPSWLLRQWEDWSYSEHSFWAHFILVAILFLMFSCGVAILYSACKYVRSAYPEPEYEPAEPPNLGEKLITLFTICISNLRGLSDALFDLTDFQTQSRLRFNAMEEEYENFKISADQQRSSLQN